MSSSIFNKLDSWDVSNVMFWRIIDFAGEVGAERASSHVERVWVERIVNLQQSEISYSPDLDAEEFFEGTEELEFWVRVLAELATRIYQRTIGNQDDQNWQVSTIWAAYDLSRLLWTTANYLRPAIDNSPTTRPPN